MKKIIMTALAALALGIIGCTTVPVDVFQLREGTPVEVIRSMIAMKPDRIVHYFKDGHSYERWTFKNSTVFIGFMDGELSEWQN